MNKSNLVKYGVIALVIIGVFYLGSLNSRIASLEKITGGSNTPTTASTTPKAKVGIAEFLASAVDKNKLQACLDSGKYDSQIASDQALAQSLNVQGTPGFYINTTNFAGAYSYTTMESAVNAGLQGTTLPAKSGSTVTLDQVKNAFNKALIKFGDVNSKVIALEISDPSCPYCQIAGGKNSTLNNQSAQFKLVADGGTYVSPVLEFKKLADSGKAAFALIYYPGHGNGERAMKALYCAFEQGKFWEANDIIMSAAGYDYMNN